MICIIIVVYFKICELIKCKRISYGGEFRIVNKCFINYYN